jgi:hypothetical protein
MSLHPVCQGLLYHPVTAPVASLLTRPRQTCRDRVAFTVKPVVRVCVVAQDPATDAVVLRPVLSGPSNLKPRVRIVLRSPNRRSRDEHVPQIDRRMHIGRRLVASQRACAENWRVPAMGAPNRVGMSRSLLNLAMRSGSRVHDYETWA